MQLKPHCSGVNHNDHKPICGFFDISLDLNLAKFGKNSLRTGYNSYSLRWDKSNLNDYYNVSRDLLSNIIFDTNLSHCDHNCKSCLHVDIIKDYYRLIVHALINAEKQTISHVPHRARRLFWNDALDELKQKSLFWFNLWRENGSTHEDIYTILLCNNFSNFFSIKISNLKQSIRAKLGSPIISPPPPDAPFNGTPLSILPFVTPAEQTSVDHSVQIIPNGLHTNVPSQILQ